MKKSVELVPTDVLDLPWKKTFIAIMRKNSMNKLVHSNEYCFSEKHDSFLKRNWDLISEFTLLDPFRLGKLLDILDNLSEVDGDIVECGSYKGGTGILLALFLKHQGISKHIHLFDSFEGLPEPDSGNDKGYKKGEFKSELDELKNRIDQLGLTDSITLHKGWFRDSVPDYKKLNHTIALLHIDCDLYESTLDSYPALEVLVASKGAVVFDDYNDGAGGERKAVLEKIHGSKNLHIGPAPQVYYYNNEEENSGVTYNFSELLENTAYLDWLQKIGNTDYTRLIRSL